MPVEGGSDSGGGAEPGEAADVFDGLAGRFEQFTGAVEASLHFSYGGGRTSWATSW